MVKIISKRGYPKADEVLVIVDYYINASPSEGGILIVGKDSQGREYKPKTEPAVRSFYVLPSGTRSYVFPSETQSCVLFSGTLYSVAVGSNPEKNHPAIHFPFQLETRRWNPRIIYGTLEKQDFDDEFFDKFDLTLMNETRQRISLDGEVGWIFKEIAVWGAYELKISGRNSFWGEMYRERTPALEKFLEDYRG